MSEPTINPAATSFPLPTISLPLGYDVLRTFSGVLMCLEIVFGGLVWVLVASSDVPVPLLQGWVMFVSITTFGLSSMYLIFLLTGLAETIITDWNVVDMVYHSIAFLFYFAAFALEAATTAANGGVELQPQPNSTDFVLCITYPQGNIFTLLDDRQYTINLAATVFAFMVTICYFFSMMMGFKRWRM